MKGVNVVGTVTVFTLLVLGIYAAVPIVNNGLSVKGNQIINGNGNAVRLLGVSRSGSEYMCVQNRGIFDGPVDDASIDAILSWSTNAVRVPLNEDCWLGINGVNAAYSGVNYINNITDFARRLNKKGLAVILELHITAPGSTLATSQNPMPDLDHSVDFWISVASTNGLGNNTSIIFDLFNEPYPDNNAWNSKAGWLCWKNATKCNLGYQAVGMQQLVNAVRSTGATNILMLGGLSYSNSLAQWLEYMPYDPLHSLAASWHSYNFNYCNNQQCWNEYVEPVAAKVPVITGEIGENDCQDVYIDPLMSWLDTRYISYLAWCWDDWANDCSGGPCLITDYEGTPTGYGVGYRNHLNSLNHNSTTLLFQY